MFTWICPQCGREVPPAYTECPNCSKLAAEGAGGNPQAPPQGPPQGPGAPPPLGSGAPPAYTPGPPQPPQQQPQQHPPQQQAPQYYQQQPPQYQPQYQQGPPQYQQGPPQYQQGPPPPGYYLPNQPRRTLTLPVWLMTVLFAVGVAGVVFAMVTLMSTSKGSAGSGPAPTAAVENPSAKPGTKASPMQKYIEISGVRFTTDAKKKVLVRFVLINHSTADINGLAGNVTVWGSTKKSEEDAQGSLSFTTNLGALESKELTVPFTTKLRIYELADWQNITTDVQITAPVQ
jgi:hypothetical protein